MASRRAIRAYVGIGGLFTLGASLIWAINTVFVIRVGGLDLFGAMLVNTSYTVSQMVFEVPTGVIADTLGRRISILLSFVIIMLSTVLYVLTPMLGWGIMGFFGASILLGLGYTFQTGAIDAWIVDALDFTGWELPKDRVFAWGQTSIAVGMMVGSLAGGLLGQVDLRLPYAVRTVVLAICFVAALAVVRDVGFTPRPLKLSSFGTETRTVFDAGVAFGWRSRVIRPVLWASAISGLFFMYGFYAWQPYVLALLGRDSVWLLGVVQAASSAAGIAGNAIVSRATKKRPELAGNPKVLYAMGVVSAVAIAAIGAVGIVWRSTGIAPAAAAIGLWLVWGVGFGIVTPIRMSYLNRHIPSSQRATVLSLDAFFADGGAAAGQPFFGWLSKQVSISIAWLVGSVVLLVAAPFYSVSGKAADAVDE